MAEKISNTEQKKPKESRITAEEGRLTKQFNQINGKKRAVVRGLIQRAAFMRASLDDLEDDLNENGFIEPFSQGDQEPYDRKRPAADLYNTMNANYQKIVKQLTDLLPRDEAAAPPPDDGFDDFANGRDDV